jgi:glycerol-3-phosphate dehydrogenase
VIGGKWTTFRKMGEDTVDKIILSGMLSAKPSRSSELNIESNTKFEGHSFVAEDLPYSLNDFRNIIKNEMVETIDDLLSRRTRCTFLSKSATKAILPSAANLLKELRKWDNDKFDLELQKFITLHKL